MSNITKNFILITLFSLVVACKEKSPVVKISSKEDKKSKKHKIRDVELSLIEKQRELANDLSSRENSDEVLQFRQATKDIIPNRPDYPLKFKAFWLETLRGNFERPLENASLEVNSGERLPDAAKLLLGSDNNIQDLAYANTVEEVKAAKWLANLAGFDNYSGGDVFSELLLERSSKLPPSQQDMAILDIFLSSQSELYSGEKSVHENWKPLSKSPSAVYRLIALKSVPYSVPEEALGLSQEGEEFNKVVKISMSDFVRSYKEETDPLILREVIHLSDTHTLNEALDFLEDLRSNETVQLNLELSDYLEKTIEKFRK